jgi:long-chain acyl-CoA synthetase
LFNSAIAVGWRRFSREQGLLVGDSLTAATDALAWTILDPLVAQKLRAQFGGRLRVAVSGGAALSQAISHCFLGLGIPIVQGYGMTETSPVSFQTTPDDPIERRIQRLAAFPFARSLRRDAHFG